MTTANNATGTVTNRGNGLDGGTITTSETIDLASCDPTVLRRRLPPSRLINRVTHCCWQQPHQLSIFGVATPGDSGTNR